MSDNSLWYGVLDAGDKSSPVLLDRRMNTGNAKTVYIFNLKRGAILEYSREIVEPKLREFGTGEDGVIAELKEGFTEAKRNFKPRGAKVLNIPERSAPAASRKAPVEKEVEDELVGAEAGDGDDEEWEDDED